MLQVASCVLMPLFTNAATEVDEDGNVEFDLRPMIGAYAVTVVKFAALFALHGGVIAISAAVYLMTPETCMMVDRPMDTARLMEGAGVTLAIILGALLFSSG